MSYNEVIKTPEGMPFYTVFYLDRTLMKEGVKAGWEHDPNNDRQIDTLVEVAFVRKSGWREIATLTVTFDIKCDNLRDALKDATAVMKTAEGTRELRGYDMPDYCRQAKEFFNTRNFAYYGKWTRR